MKEKFLQFGYLMAMLLTLCMLAACGGDGDDDDGTTVSGVAAKGPVRGGTVNVYAVNADGSRGALLGTATTSSTDGSYQVEDLDHEGNIIVIVTGGTYTDEATGAQRPNPGLKAAVPNASGDVNVAVTPLTHVAFQQMSSATGGFSAANINRYNSLVSTAFGVDIIGTQPVNATNATEVANARQSSIEYGTALAAISQMVNSGAATSVPDAVARIRTDLSATTPRLTTTGPAMTTAITQLTSGATPRLAPTITPDTISLDNTVTFFTTNTVNPPANTTGVAQAKALVSDLRNTILSVYDYNTGEFSAVLTTPYEETIEEIQTVIEPELADAIDRLAWLGSSLADIPEITAGSTYTFTDPVGRPNETLTIAAAQDGRTLNLRIANPTTTLLSGTATVNDANNPTSGNLNIPTLRTRSGNGTVTASFEMNTSGDRLNSLNLEGNMTTPVATFDFSDLTDGRLSLSFGTAPNDPDTTTVTRAYFKGRAESGTARITGAIDFPNWVWNTNMSTDTGSTIPTSGTVTAKIEALENNATTLTLDGVLTGAFSNAATYNPNIADSATNFPNWNASFDGSIVQPDGLNLTTLLKASMREYQRLNFEAKYTREFPDGTTIFLDSTGNSNLETGITTVQMTNQDSLRVDLNYNENLATDQRLSGTIKTSGGETVGTFSSVGGVPRVTYSDGYFETLL